jgi:cytochrome c-type biogenesis protein CcmH
MKKIALILICLFFFSTNINSEENLIKKIEIYKNLRCLVCQGQSIADSNSDFAQTIKLVIEDQIKEGKSEKEIYKFLISKYGDWVVFKPLFNKTNFLLWFLPYLFLILGAMTIFFLIKKRNNKDN